ncbi:hypothetical protein DP092_15265 [Pseudomonas sp. MDMC224]|nr:hypothetical protein DP092_15265 [Pseudomonas sp. MDMC224]
MHTATLQRRGRTLADKYKREGMWQATAPHTPRQVASSELADHSGWWWPVKTQRERIGWTFHRSTSDNEAQNHGLPSRMSTLDVARPLLRSDSSTLTLDCKGPAGGQVKLRSSRCRHRSRASSLLQSRQKPL